ncbi:ketopantoate reductase family protein [Ectopseudomonas oleovorans]|uniref:2-dehydropantoate 2-reductase n=1 Tax=Ectopseudomonas oleovorans TaxID=301 RepID=A0AA42QDS2_ECTOL|nr:2-dehydropantoate 2-reductase [Pseudomonas oleovorans]MDH1339308.1 2-dehydropantoate 2-reductase [Pseudomonas oleovorans]MDH1492554.1 2-dehydropantoate 2-reductase [Pseudomonas oleovorans]WGG21197.1 2-dehydropantoate 2-reductase [Pseudomonas oleovorans]
MATSPYRVCIAGAGAIGCTLAARLVASGQAVSLLARGQTLSALRDNGILLSDLDGEHCAQVNVSDDCNALGEQDLLFICTKAPALAGLLPTLAPLIGADTVVVPVVNGVPWWYFHGIEGRFAERHVEAVDPDGVLSAALNLQQVLGCVVFITAETAGPGVVRSNNPHLMILGEPNNQMSERLERVRALIERAGIEARSTDRIRDQLWTKIIANLTSNPLSVITGATLEQLYGKGELKQVVAKILQETLLTAAAYGARINFDPQTFMELGAGMGPVRTSMLQDYEQGRPLELAAIGDAVLELASYQGLAMPTTQDILTLARFRGAQAPAH